MSIYDRILEQAREAERTHWERDEARTRAFFASHPENRRAIIGMRDDGSVVRSDRRMIDIEMRMGAGWFERCVGRDARDERIWWLMPSGEADVLGDEVGALVNVNDYARAWSAGLIEAHRRRLVTMPSRRLVKQAITGRRDYVTMEEGRERQPEGTTAKIARIGAITT